jgi:hypothetical protein
LQYQASARFGGEEKYCIRCGGIVSNKRILVIEALLTEAGFSIIGPAATVPAALKHISKGNFDAALVDANLGGDSVEDRGTPFGLVTGYSRKSLPPNLPMRRLSKTVRSSDRNRCRSEAFLALSAGVL